MSTLETAEPAPTPSSLKPGTIFRLSAIALGIASATLLAHSAFGIRFNEDFLLFLAVVRRIVGGIALPFELLLVRPVVGWLHEQGFVFELRDHWRNAFVLLWLFNVSASRAFSPLSLILGGGAALRVRVAFRWAWAALAALLGGTLAGTVPLDHQAVLWWPVSAFFLYTLGGRASLLQGALGIAFAIPFGVLALGWVEPFAIAGHPPLFWWPVAAFFAFLGVGRLVWALQGWAVATHLAAAVLSFALAAVAGLLAVGVLPGPAWLAFEHSPSPGLANLTAFVAVLAAWFLFDALIDPEMGGVGLLKRMFDSRSARTGLDVLAVLGGAAIITYLAHLMG